TPLAAFVIWLTNGLRDRGEQGRRVWRAECAPTPRPHTVLVERAAILAPPAYRPCAIAAIIRGITIGLSNNVRFLAGELGRRGSSARLAMRGTPFGQPDVPTENGLFIARLSKMERLVWCERPPS